MHNFISTFQIAREHAFISPSFRRCHSRGSYTLKIFLDSYRKMRELHLWVQLFNHLNSYGIFLFKIYCILLGIVWGYFVVSHMEHFPYFLAFFAIFADVTLLYSVLYEKAFQVPGELQLVRKKMLLGINCPGRNLKVRRYGQRCLRTIPSLGIRVGSFHSFEKTSTPIFIDFVIRNIAGLLVMKIKA